MERRERRKNERNEGKRKEEDVLGKEEDRKESIKENWKRRLN